MPEIDNQSSRRKKISAFALAKIDFSVRAEIGLDDVKSLRPAWNEAECMQFLRQFGDEIGREMAMAGLSLWPHCSKETAVPTETEDSAIVLKEVDERFYVRDEKSASWLVRKIVEERAYRQRVSDWHEAETRRSERREQFLLNRFGGELAEWARQQLEKQYGNRRSLHLPSGVVGFRLEATRIVVTDEPKLIGWCRQNLPSAVKVVESVLKSEISAHIKTSGECPDGAELAGGVEKFFIK